MSQQQQQQQEQLMRPQPMLTPFSGISQPLSFRDIAQRSNSSNYTASSVAASTLLQYGPVVESLVSGVSCSHIIPQVPVYPLNVPRSRPHQTGSILNSQSTVTTTDAANFHQAPSSSLGTPSQSNDLVDPDVSQIPLPPKSPPFDSFSHNNGSQRVCGIVTDVNSSNKPEQPVVREKRVKDSFEKLSMNDLISTFRNLEVELEDLRQKRSECEKELSSIARRTHGQNFEMNPEFRAKKQDENAYNRRCRELSNDMKMIQEISVGKYNHHIQNTNKVQQPLQRQPFKMSAKMSTAAPILPKPNTDQNDRKIFELNDGKIWCKDCDNHYDDLKEFCEHLHHREHKLNMNKPNPPPWRNSPGQRLTRSRTYDLTKSICAKLSNKFRTTFTVQNVDEVLNPTKGNTDAIKNLHLERERGKFSDGDPLLCVKGYEYLVPVSGFYCKLCDRTLCDFQEVEQHLKGMSHNSEFYKNIALNPNGERTFRLSLYKSAAERQRRAEAKRKRDASGETTTGVATLSEASTSKSTKVIKEPSQWSARLPYKKPTSHIVDDHETVQNKFEKRPERLPLDKKSSKEKGSPEERRLISKRKELPAIVPVTQSNSSALKRLKNDKLPSSEHEAQKKTELAATSANVGAGGVEDDLEIDISPPPAISTTLEAAEVALDIVILKEISMGQGNPDSLFPHLELSVTANIYYDTLKDRRLVTPTFVNLNRIDVADCKETLLNNDLFQHVLNLVAKKEPKDSDESKEGVYYSEIEGQLSTKATYVNSDCGEIPVDLSMSSSDAENQDFQMDMLGELFIDA